MSTVIGLALGLAFAQEVPVPEGEVEVPRRTFDPREFEALRQIGEAYEEQLRERDSEMEELRRQLEARAREQGLLPEPSKGDAPDAPDAPATPPPAQVAPPRSTAAPTPGSGRDGMRSVQVGDTVRPLPIDRGSLGRALVFSVPDGVDAERVSVVPAGSYVKGRVLSGVEANAQLEIPMLVQLDHAVVGPNRHRMDLRGCMVLLKVKGELSTDRVVGEAVRLSCVRNSGEAVDRQIRGYLVGEDSTFGVTGQLISRQGRVIAAAALASLAEAAGSAVARAQEVSQIVTNPVGATTPDVVVGNPTAVTNVEGSQLAYALGSGGASAAGRIADWYLRYADQLVPAIAVGSGRDIWIVLLEPAEVPALEEAP